MSPHELKQKIHCRICRRPIDELEITEDLILCQTLYIAHCHGKEQKINRVHFSLDMSPVLVF